MEVSVVVPVQNEEATISQLLESLWGQTRPASEIIIVDGGSTDGTLRVAEEYLLVGMPLRILRLERAFPGEGRNHGVAAAKSNLIAFTDAGVEVNSKWLEKLIEPVERDASVDVVYGHYEPITDTFFKECAALAFVPAPAERDGRQVRAPFIASSLMQRAVWEAVGGFPPYRAAEDLIFMEAIEKKKFKIAYASEAVVYWQIPSDWTKTFRRFAEYSRHNLIAKRARYWHYGVARLYAAGAIFLALALVHSPVWALLPAVGLVGRTVRAAYRKRCAFAFRDVFRLKRLLYLLGLLILLDAATVWGFCVWVWKDRLFGTSPT
jgi:glycosyltransferase involved in cell wall biosynthesis